MRKRVRRLAIIIVAFAVTFTSLPLMTGEFVAHAASIPTSKVKSLQASKHDRGKVTFAWSKIAGQNVTGWQLKYRTRSYPSGKWTGWKYVNLSAGTTSRAIKVKRNRVVEVHVRAKGDKSWSKGIITIPAGSTYQSIYKTFVKNASTNKRINSITLTVGQSIKIKPDHEYWVKNYKKRPRLYPNNMLYDSYNRSILQLKHSNGKAYTSGSIVGVATVKALKAGETTLLCRAVNGRTKSIKVVVKPKATSASATQKDSLFESSSLANKTVNIADGNQYINFSVNTSGSVKWSVSGDACAIYGSKTNSTVTVYCYLEGTAKLTCANHDGNTRSCTITVTKGTPSSSGSGGSGGGQQSNGITTSYGVVYPSADGSFTIQNDNNNSNNWNSDPIKINGAESDLSVITELPNNSVIKMDINDMNSNTTEAMGRMYTFSQKKITCSNQDVALVYNGTRPRFYLVSEGSATINIGNSSYKFIVTGKNNDLYDYRKFVEGFPETVNGLAAYDKANAALNYVHSLAYDQGRYGNACALYKYKSGDCTAGAELVADLCSSVEIENEIYNAIDYDQSTSQSHVNIAIYIDGEKYWANATPEHGSSCFRLWD